MKLIILFTIFLFFFLSSVECKEHHPRIQLETSLTQGFIPAGWNEIAMPSGIESISLTLAIKQQNVQQLAQLLEQTGDIYSPKYGQWSTYDQVSEMLRPSATCEQIIFEQWLPSFPEIVVVSRPSPDWATISAPLAVLEHLLGVQMKAFLHQESGMTVVRSPAGYSVPLYVSDCLDFIGGLIRFPRIQPAAVQQQLLREATAIYEFKTTPESIQQRYNVSIPASSPTNLQAVASFLQQYFSPADLSSFQQLFSQPETPIAQILGTNDAANPGTEASLDVQYLTGVTNTSITTWVYSTDGETPSGNEPFLDWLLFLQSQNQPNVYSISYQDYENTVSIEYASRVCTEFMKFTQAGKTFFTGSYVLLLFIYYILFFFSFYLLFFFFI